MRSTEALDILQDQFTRDEAQEVADAVCDVLVAEYDDRKKEFPLHRRWEVERAVLGVFGYEQEEEPDE
jgi:hypothetical protein